MAAMIAGRISTPLMPWGLAGRFFPFELALFLAGALA